MGISRSTFYDIPHVHARDLTIVAEMKTICDEFEAYGYRRVDAELRHRGIVVNTKKIRRLMREHALNPKQHRRFIATTDSNHDYPIFPDLAKSPRCHPAFHTWRNVMTNKAQQIRALKDDLRQHLIGGGAVITPGIAALGREAVDRIVKAIAGYDGFCHGNDPYREHDFGSFEAEGKTIFFKIDYYDKALAAHSPDPANSSVSERVITIMLAQEY